MVIHFPCRSRFTFSHAPHRRATTTNLPSPTSHRPSASSAAAQERFRLGVISIISWRTGYIWGWQRVILYLVVLLFRFISFTFIYEMYCSILLEIWATTSCGMSYITVIIFDTFWATLPSPLFSFSVHLSSVELSQVELVCAEHASRVIVELGFTDGFRWLCPCFCLFSSDLLRCFSARNGCSISLLSRGWLLCL